VSYRPPQLLATSGRAFAATRQGRSATCHHRHPLGRGDFTPACFIYGAYPALTKTPPVNGKLIALPVLGGVQHDYRLAG